MFNVVTQIKLNSSNRLVHEQAKPDIEVNSFNKCRWSDFPFRCFHEARLVFCFSNCLQVKVVSKTTTIQRWTIVVDDSPQNGDICSQFHLINAKQNILNLMRQRNVCSTSVRIEFTLINFVATCGCLVQWKCCLYLFYIRRDTQFPT